MTTTTAINSFQDILDALEQNPEYRDAMRRLILDDEFLQLPAIVRELQETVADLARTVREYMAATNARLDRLEAGQARLEAGQEELRAGHDELRAGQKELRAGQSRLEAGHDELRAGQDELRAGQEELRAGHDELRAGQNEIRERQDRMEGDIAELKTGQARMQDDIAELQAGQARMQGDITELQAGQTLMQEDIAELKAGQNRMQGQLNNLSGTDYERRVARFLRRYAIRRLNLYNAALLYSVTLPDNNTIPEMLDAAVAAGVITNDVADELAEVDLVVSGNFGAADGELVYVAAEVSITVFEDDVDRAKERAAILAQISGMPVKAAVVGDTVFDYIGEYAARNGVAAVRISQ